jgi:CHAT domain
MVYQDFDLLIDRSGRYLRAQVLNSPAGQASAEFRLPFTEDKLENYLLRLGRARPATRRVESQEMNTAKAFGAALFDAVFSGDVKACFRSSIDEVRRQNAGLRIRLRLGDPSVVDLPWEFLYNRSVNRFVALSVHTPLVRYMDLPERIQPIAVKPPIRVLTMISSPTDFPALDVEGEWSRLNEALKDRIAAGQLAIERLDAASLEALQRRLRRETYHIFHFIGHGEFDQELQEGVLILEAENRRGHKVDSQFLGMLLHDHESLRIAILNACEGARTSRTDPFAGSAQSLVQQGIPAVIAMQFEIADDVASRFAHEFYGALADGYPIDASLTEARKSIFAAGREVEWGTPVLYLRAPDGRIFDIETSGTRGAGSEKVVEPSSHVGQDRFADAIVAAAHAAFAGGQRIQAIEMLRRHGPPKGAVADALRELTLEHERLVNEGRRATRDKLDEHLRAAGALLARGKLSEAWNRARDALQLDSSDKKAIAFEARIRKALDDQAARDVAHEQQEARRAQEARARQIERANALTRSRMAIEHSIAAGDLDHAEEELRRADESYDPGGQFADLRTHVVELRREAELRQDRLADQVIEQARQEFSTTPLRAVELLERFSPPHPRVTAALRKLQELIAEQNEQANREAERRGEEERERQRNKEQRRRDMQQAVERIRGYLDRDELTEAAAALEAAEGAFGPASVFQELRARAKVAQRRLQHDDAARSAIGRGRNLAAAGDYRAALNLLEAFRPRHPEVDAVVEALHREQSSVSGRLQTVASLVSQPRFLWAAAVILIVAAATLWLLPRAISRWRQSPAAPVAASADELVKRFEPPRPAAVPPAASAPSSAPEAAAVPSGAPAATPEVPEAAPEPTSAPPAATTGTLATRPGPPDDKTIADYRNRIQTLLQKKDSEQAVAVLTNALADAPRDKGLRAIGARVVEDAQDRALRERSRAVALGGSGLAAFKQADRTAQQARSLSREGKSAAAGRAYLDAADLFASAATESAKRRGPGRPARGDDDPVREAEAVPAAEPPPTAPPAKSDLPAVGAKPSLPPTDPVIDAYALAIVKGDRTAMLAVYPGAPADLLANLGKRVPGYSMRIANRRIIRDDRGRPEVDLTLVHESSTSGAREERLVLTLELVGESWKVVGIRSR